MLKNIVLRKHVEITERAIEFTSLEGYGFSFDCDENGNPTFACEAAKKNYEYAMKNPDEFAVQFNQVVVRKRTYIELAHGTCACGNVVELYDQYQGACSCPKCGRWYNLFGRELVPPEYWEE